MTSKWLVSAVRFSGGNYSTIIASQIPTSEWYKLIPSPTIADAILDRLLHNSHRIELTGGSMRKLDQSDHLA